MGATQSYSNAPHPSCSTSMRCLPSLSTWRSRKGCQIRCKSISVLDAQQPLRLHSHLASPSELSTCNPDDTSPLPQTMPGLQVDFLSHLFAGPRTNVGDTSSSQPNAITVECSGKREEASAEDDQLWRDGVQLSQSRPTSQRESMTGNPIALDLSSEAVSSSLDDISSAVSPHPSAVSQTAATGPEDCPDLDPPARSISEQALDNDISDFYIAAPPIQPSTPEKSTTRSVRELSRQAGAPYMLILAVASMVKDEVLSKRLSHRKRVAEGPVSSTPAPHKRHRPSDCSSKDLSADAPCASQPLPPGPGHAIVLVPNLEQSPRFTAPNCARLFSGDFPPLPKLQPNILLDSGAWSDFGGLLLENGSPGSPSTSTASADDARCIDSQPLPAIPKSLEDAITSSSPCEPALSLVLSGKEDEIEPFSSITPLQPRHDTPVPALLPSNPLPAGAAALLLQPTNIPRRSKNKRNAARSATRQTSKIPAPPGRKQPLVPRNSSLGASAGRHGNKAGPQMRGHTPSTTLQRRPAEEFVTPAPSKSRRIMPSWKVSLTSDSSSSCWKVVSASTADSRSSRPFERTPLRSCIDEVRSMRQELRSCWHLPNLDLTLLASEVDSLMSLIQLDSPPALKMEAAGLQAEFDAIVHGMQERSDELALNRALRAFTLKR